MKITQLLKVGGYYLSLATIALLITTSAAFAFPGLEQIWHIVQTVNQTSGHFNNTAPPLVGEAILSSTADPSALVGSVVLVETSEGLLMRGNLANIAPGLHGFHIHEGSSCAGEGSAAGGHFNPYGTSHGHLPSHGFTSAHVGDLGNIEVNDWGQAAWEILLPGLTLSPGDLSVANRTFVLHADADDFSQPAGNSGPRIACGVIHPLIGIDAADF